MSVSICATIELFLTARMADKRPSLTSKASKAPAKPTATSSRPTTRSTKKVKSGVSEHHEDRNAYHDAHGDGEQDDPVNEPRSRKTKSQAGTKKRPRNPTASEGEDEDTHRKKNTRTKVVRIEETEPAEHERMDEVVKVGPPKGKPSIPLTRHSVSYSTGCDSTTSTRPSLLLPLAVTTTIQRSPHVSQL